MTEDEGRRIEIGTCSNCGRTLRIKPHGLRPTMRLTCKCGQVNTLTVDQATLAQHGVVRTPVQQDIYQVSGAPLFRLLDGPLLRSRWTEEDTAHAERWKDLPRELRQPTPDIISVSMNPYTIEASARKTMGILVDRVRAMTKARPWSVELYENVDCAIVGLLAAPFYVFLGMTEVRGWSSQQNFDAFKQVVRGLHTDCPGAWSGGEWEVSSQSQGNAWRGDRCARLLERWAFLDADDVRTFGVLRSPTAGPATSAGQSALARLIAGLRGITGSESKR